jgi:hypothetical protein
MTLLFATGAWAAEKNMVYATPYGITTLDPSTSYSTELGYIANMYETLIRVNPPGSDALFSYELATGFSASKDGLEYTWAPQPMENATKKLHLQNGPSVDIRFQRSPLPQARCSPPWW